MAEPVAVHLVQLLALLLEVKAAMAHTDVAAAVAVVASLAVLQVAVVPVVMVL